ncbi:MAG TPA: STAS domain-containing protein [Streptosporangiaceae bacterium]
MSGRGVRRARTARCRSCYDDGVLRVSRTGDGRLALAGEIDEETYPVLVRCLSEAAVGAAELHLDLSGVRYCDLAGLRALIGLTDVGRRCVVLSGMSAQLEAILTILGWDSVPGLSVHRPG